MKHEGPPFGLVGAAVVLDPDHLPRSETDQGSLLVIVVLPAVNQVAAFHLLEENRIESEHLPGVSEQGDAGHFDHADQRMEGFDPEHLVVGTHRVDVEHLFIHGAKF